MIFLQSSLAALLLAHSTSAFYTKSSPVLQVDASSYRTLIEKSNHTSIVEFYAPWCGHCKNLKPAYEKAAKTLSGLAKVAAVNCDEEGNKPFCGSMGVQGFPTLKIVKPGKKPGKPIVEDYNGARTAKGIVDAIVNKIPNHVARLKDADYMEWLEANSKPKALLFSEKGTTSALIKALAVDFLDSIAVAQVRNIEKEMVEVFSVTKFPTLVLLPEDGREPLVYEGEMKKEPMVTFLSQASLPNPDSAPREKKAKAKPSPSKSKSVKPSQASETLEDEPTDSPSPEIDTEKPIKVADPVKPIPNLTDELSLQQKCFNTKAGTCILALLPEALNEDAASALISLAEIAHKHSQAGRNLFPFFSLPSSNPQASALRTALALAPTSSLHFIATNGKRAWYLLPPADSTSSQSDLETWIDAIRMGDIPASSRQELPSQFLVAADQLPPVEKKSAEEKLKVASMDDLFGGQLPEGFDVEMEPIDDEEYARLMAQQAHDEL